ncbi:hypothetical protein BB561_004953 [Smittium simulii]|uniref:ATP-dependent RNA helicase n=1 Tax=Smittium simulii TaxID=133385 RepID=A0A2T9YD22_9FUNG|nr:hypothetical protein BB561_004953 [Smittium simulii]
MYRLVSKNPNAFLKATVSVRTATQPLFASFSLANSIKPSLTSLFSSKIQKNLFSNSAIFSEYTATNKSDVIYTQPEHTSAEYVPVPFSNYTQINSKTMHAIKDVLRFKDASIVQDKIISELPSEQDFLIKAKTGTGKTIAFLVGAIETLVKYKASPSYNKDSMGILIISPTRELAKQIHQEAIKIAHYHKFGVHVLVGGESSRLQQHQINKEPLDIVVATPGRLLDIWENSNKFDRATKNLQVLVFDEADMLLDMGFQKEVARIIEQCPKERQNFLVSATFSRKVREIARQALAGKSFKELDCVDPNETNVVQRIKQSYIKINWDMHYFALHQILNSQIKKNIEETGNGSKIIIFLSSTKATQVYHDALQSFMSNRGMSVNLSYKNSRNSHKNSGNSRNLQVKNSTAIYCIHGKKTQEVRSRISDRFRNFNTSDGNSAILITTDISARGVDYPGTNFVLQVGAPSTTEQYTHRIGRTGRAGKSGEGMILISPAEMPFVRELEREQKLNLAESEEFNIEAVSNLEQALSVVNESSERNDGFGSDDNDNIDISSIDKNLLAEARNFYNRFRSYSASADTMEIEDMYISLLGHYQSLLGSFRLDPSKLVEDTSKSLIPFGIIDKPRLPSMLKASFSGNGKGFSGSRQRNRSDSRGSSRGGYNDSRESRGGSRGGYNDSKGSRDDGQYRSNDKSDFKNKSRSRSQYSSNDRTEFSYKSRDRGNSHSRQRGGSSRD